MHPWGLLQEEGEGGGLSGGQRLGEAGDHTLRRLPACLAHGLVQHAGARRPEAVCWQSMPACTEHRDGVTAEHRRWPRLRRPVLSCLGPTGPVMGEREDHAWLWYAGPLGRCRVRPWDMRTGAFREIPRGLGPRVWAEDTNHRAGVNVATRSEAIEARRDGVEGRQRRSCYGGEGTIRESRFGREARSPIAGCYGRITQAWQTFLPRGARRQLHVATRRAQPRSARLSMSTLEDRRLDVSLGMGA
jgi:hypothetical protein